MSIINHLNCIQDINKLTEELTELQNIEKDFDELTHEFQNSVDIDERSEAEKSPYWKMALKVAPIGESPRIIEIRERVIKVCKKVVQNKELSDIERKNIKYLISEMSKKLKTIKATELTTQNQYLNTINEMSQLRSQFTQQIVDLTNAFDAYWRWINLEEPVEKLDEILINIRNAVKQWKESKHEQL